MQNGGCMYDLLIFYSKPCFDYTSNWECWMANIMHMFAIYKCLHTQIESIIFGLFCVRQINIQTRKTNWQSESWLPRNRSATKSTTKNTRCGIVWNFVLIKEFTVLWFTLDRKKKINSSLMQFCVHVRLLQNCRVDVSCAQSVTQTGNHSLDGISNRMYTKSSMPCILYVRLLSKYKN